MHNKALKYIELRNNAYSILKDLRTEAIIYSEDNRKLFSGDIVEVYDKIRKITYEGVVGDCKSLVLAHLNDDISSINVLNNEKEFNEIWNNLRYQIFAKKKDGSASLKHLFDYPHFLNIEGEDLGDSDYVIRIKK